jgi:Mlc titration factor MtfA (ptsG expression regulator)
MILVAGYFAYAVDSQYALWVIGPFVALVMIFVFSPQIDWWWYKKHPPQLPKPLLAFLEKYSRFYLNLNPGDQKKFRERMALFPMSKDFKSQSEEGTVPEDIKAVVSACALPLTLQQEAFLLPKFETVIVYPRPFPSPQYPEHFHSSEIFEEDGVVIFAAEHLLNGFMEPLKYYDIGLHEWSRVWMLSQPEVQWPELEEDFWEQLTAMSRFPREAIEKWINRPDVELLPVAIVHFFHFPRQFLAVAPSVYVQFQILFNAKSVN